MLSGLLILEDLQTSRRSLLPFSVSVTEELASILENDLQENQFAIDKGLLPYLLSFFSSLHFDHIRKRNHGSELHVRLVFFHLKTF